MILTQVQEGQWVIPYTSRRLRENEKNPSNCSSFKLELLAVLWAVTDKSADILTGTEFLLLTDNSPLVFEYGEVGGPGKELGGLFEQVQFQNPV